MSQRSAFIPGRPGTVAPPLAPYRPQQPLGAARGYVRDITPSSGLVVDLFCQGPQFVREAVDLGRRALGFSVNPVLLRAARIGLAPPDPEALSAAFTHLADSPKGDVALSTHLLSLYRTRCPVCEADGVAEWFAWNRDRDRPFEKAVRCSQCGELQIGPADADDVALAQSFAPRALSYYYALDRAAPLDDPVRERAAELVECYTRRNLSALMDVGRRVEGTEASESVRTALEGLLLDCFDRCSKLHPHDEDRPRPRTLRIPVRYLERNVWRCLEERLSTYTAHVDEVVPTETRDVEGLIGGTGEGYALVAQAARHVDQILPRASVDLFLVDPPRPDGVFWALSALWTAWLSRSGEARAVRPFLRRRRFDWDWHCRAFQDVLRVAGPLLQERGRLVMLFAERAESLLQSVCIAASKAGFRLEGWGYAPEVGHRLTWSWEGPVRSPRTADAHLRQELRAEVGSAVTETLRRRGEPSSESLLQAAAHTHLARRGLLRIAAEPESDVSARQFVAEAVELGFGDVPMARLARDTPQQDDGWWLRGPRESDAPLADRVENLVRELLSERLAWVDSELINAIYGRFSGVLTPDVTLVETCLSSYGVHDGSEVRLRPEDDFEQRCREMETVSQQLASLGRRLEFRISAAEGWDVCWSAGGKPVYVFALSSTAEVASRLLADPSAHPECEKCLVVPGGRAELIHLKLRRDPRLADAVDSGGWQFVKFRHLRRLLGEEDLDRHAFEMVLGLDPIAEREHTQLPLL